MGYKCKTKLNIKQRLYFLWWYELKVISLQALKQSRTLKHNDNEREFNIQHKADKR